MKEKGTIGEMSRINFRRMEGDQVKLDFTKVTNGIGRIHLYYAGKFVKTMNIDLTGDMDVSGMEMRRHG